MSLNTEHLKFLRIVYQARLQPGFSRSVRGQLIPGFSR
jgi:hypothetical protein